MGSIPTRDTEMEFTAAKKSNLNAACCINMDMDTNDVDYAAIQTAFDSGLTWRDVTAKFGFSESVIRTAKARGLIKTKSRSEAMRASHKAHPRPSPSQETRRKISIARTAYLVKNPDKVPYRLNHKSKGPSYPEKYFMRVFAEENIPLEYHLRVGIYELDFYHKESMFCLEIDGEQHYTDARIVESDKRRTEFLKNLGWVVCRIRWQAYQKLTDAGKHDVVTAIRNAITSSSARDGISDVTNLDCIRVEKTCAVCGCVISRGAKRWCRSCSPKAQRHISTRKFDPSVDELARVLDECGWKYARAGRHYGVSDNAVKKRCKVLNLVRPRNSSG